MKRLPKTIFVSEENESDSTYLVAHYNSESACAVGERKRVGVYVLDHYATLTGKVDVVHETKKR